MNRQRKTTWIILLALLALVFLYIVVAYNRLVSLDEKVKRTWGDLQTTYQRRIDLTPALVAVVKGSSDYEKQTLAQLAEARAKAMQATVSNQAVSAEGYNRQEQAQAEMALSVNRVIGIVEKYPDLQTSKSFLYLQSQLEGTERRIKVARNDFNQSVADYNRSSRGFPSGLVAGIFGFKTKEGFKAEAGTENPPEVKF